MPATDDVDAEAGRISALLNRVRPPAGPLTGRWALGIGDIVADTARLPQRLRGAARLLNRFGGVAVTAEALEFDGDDVEWSKMTELDTRNLVEYLLSGAVEKQVDRLPVPWFPGRGKVLSPGLLATLILADPRVSECMVTTAKANGVTVGKPDHDPMDVAGERAEQLKAGIAALEQRVSRLIHCR